MGDDTGDDTDFEHLDPVDGDDDVPAEARRFARYLRLIVSAASVRPEPGMHTTALACRRRPGRRACPGRLRVRRHDAAPEVSVIEWGCPACGENGVISNWRGSFFDLTEVARPGQLPGARRVVLSAGDYGLLLDELGLDTELGPILVAARWHRDGAELQGDDGELDELRVGIELAAAATPVASRRRRLRAVAAALGGRRGTWLEQSREVVASELAGFGLVAPAAQLDELLRRRVSAVASALGISERAARRYVNDESLREVGREAAIQLADEHPGANLLELARTVAVPMPALGACIAALAEAGRARLNDADDCTGGASAALQLLALLGQLLRDAGGEPGATAAMPRAALTRSARLLEAGAQLLLDGALQLDDVPDGAVALLAEHLGEEAAALRQLAAPPR